jgi:hypothetical protein
MTLMKSVLLPILREDLSPVRGLNLSCIAVEVLPIAQHLKRRQAW